jgi:flagellar protein FliO/FliZ
MKYGTRKLQNMQNGKFIKVLERVPISKDNSLIVVKIGDKGYVLTSSASSIDKLMELKDDELKKLENTNSIPEYKNMMEFYKKVFKKKEDNI